MFFLGFPIVLTHGMSQFVEPGADRLLARIKEMGWFLRIDCEKDELVEAAPTLRRADVRFMVDHFGRPDVARGLTHPGFQALLEFRRSGNAVAKLSGPFRSSVEGYPYRDVDPFPRGRWASCWPVTRGRPRRMGRRSDGRHEAARTLAAVAGCGGLTIVSRPG